MGGDASESAASAHTTPGHVPARRAEWLSLLLAASLVAGAVVGHYSKPHGDFFEFRETGRALLRGEWPETSKRAPLFPVLLAGLGSAIAALMPAVATPDARAAEILGAASIVTSVLCAVLLLRAWRAARGAVAHEGESGVAHTAALLILLAPLGLQCAALGLVEPLLAALMLLTVVLAARGSPWAWAAAGAACVARFDAVGLLAGLLIQPPGSERRTRRDLSRAALASTPAVIWLLFTLLTWGDHSRDHYVSQMLERPLFSPGFVVGAGGRAAFPIEGVALTPADGDLQNAMGRIVRASLAMLAALGAASVMLRRLPGAAAMLGFAAVYVVIHAAFPFQLERFGYPLAPVVLLLAAIGALRLGDALVPLTRAAPWVVGVLAGLGAVACVSVIVGESDRLSLAARRAPAMLWLVPIGGAFAAMLVFVQSVQNNTRGVGRRLATASIGLACVALSMAQSRAALESLGTGREMQSLADAAAWVRDNTSPPDRVLSAIPGLLRLYDRSDDAFRYVGLERMPGDDLAAILRDCSREGVRYIVWYDDLFAEQGEYYVRKWRLERYAPLDAETPPVGLRLVHHIDGPPRVRVFEVESAK